LRTIPQGQQIILEKVHSIQERGISQEKRHAKIKKQLLEIYPALDADLTSEEGEEEDMKKENKFEELYAPSTTPDQVHSFVCGESPGASMSPEEEEEAGKALLPGEPAIPVGHTTGAARLLLWPAVKNFIHEILKKHTVKRENFVEYPNIKENKHGLRIYGGAGSYGQLELDECTVHRLIDSYLKYMHIMHPILDPAELRAYARKFIKTLPPYQGSNPKTPNIKPPRFVNSGTETHGVKRKRTSPPVNTTELPEVTAPHPLKPGRPQRSIQNAVLLLVLALGKICEHRTKIPDVLPDHESTSSGSPHIRSGYLSPMLASPVVSSQSPGLPSRQEGDRNRSTLRRKSTESYITPQTILLSRNLDVIPGLAYAAFATDILGNEIGENTLYHVHANILASLYFGQLARPSYSHRFINNASIGLQVILRLLVSFLTPPDQY
jgi:hypothetical protein